MEGRVCVEWKSSAFAWVILWFIDTTGIRTADHVGEYCMILTLPTGSCRINLKRLFRKSPRQVTRLHVTRLSVIPTSPRWSKNSISQKCVPKLAEITGAEKGLNWIICCGVLLAPGCVAERNPKVCLSICLRECRGFWIFFDSADVTKRKYNAQTHTLYYLFHFKYSLPFLQKQGLLFRIWVIVWIDFFSFPPSLHTIFNFTCIISSWLTHHTNYYLGRRTKQHALSILHSAIFQFRQTLFLLSTALGTQINNEGFAWLRQ